MALVKCPIVLRANPGMRYWLLLTIALVVVGNASAQNQPARSPITVGQGTVSIPADGGGNGSKSQPLVLPQQDGSARWVILTPPLKPSPYAPGQWTVDYAAPSEKWTASENFQSEQDCQNAVTLHQSEMAQGVTAASSTNTEKRIAAIKAYKAAILAGGSASDSLKIIQSANQPVAQMIPLFDQAKFAKCAPVSRSD
jgi:hypothetical protein